jgi:thiol-disulfide isomerase/thioredoxin
MNTTGQAQDEKTTIRGEIKSLKEGAVVELLDGATYARGETVAKTEVTNGTFTFTIEIEEPRYFCIETGASTGNFFLVVEPGDQMELKGESFHGLQHGGSKAQQKLEELTTTVQREYSAKYRSAPEEEKTALMENHWGKEIPQLIADNSDHFLAPILIYRYSGNVKPSEKQYAALSEKVKNGFHGKALRAYLDTFLIGKQAPAFAAKDVNGKEYTLVSLLDGNKYLLVDFWASWCVPCRKGIPEMKVFAKKYAGKGLAVVSISTDAKREDWVKALEEEKMPWTNLLDENGVKKAYGVGGIPSVFLIDASGKVLFEKLYGEAIGKELEKVFGE